MNCNIQIQNVGTGEVRGFTETSTLSFDQIYWQWTEGNYGCDCNRSLFFFTREELAFEDAACSEGMFKVNIKSADGCEILKEF